MKKIISLVVLMLLYCHSGWALTRYVSPSGDGSNPSSGVWSEASPTVNSAINIANSDGDVIVLQNVTTHVFNANAQILADITIRNENNDENYFACAVTVSDDVRLRSDWAPNDETVVIKGVTFQGANYSNVAYGFLSTASGFTGTWDFTSVRFQQFTSTAAHKYGVVAKLFGVAGATLNMTRCVISNNTGGIDRAPLIYIQGYDIDIDTLTYSSNGAVGRGGQFKISTLAGGAAQTLSITNSTFQNNFAINSAYNGGDGVLNIINAANDATAIVTGTIENTNFISNTANMGAALYTGQDSRITVNRCLFYDNYAYGNGGALRRGGENDNSSDGYTKIYYSNFTNNYSGISGGAIDINASNRHKWAEIYNSSFSGNTAAINGETIHSSNANDLNNQKSIIKNCNIEGTLEGREYHIYSLGGDGFDTISYSDISGEVSAISDAGATISNIGGGYDQ